MRKSRADSGRYRTFTLKRPLLLQDTLRSIVLYDVYLTSVFITEATDERYLPGLRLRYPRKPDLLREPCVLKLLSVSAPCIVDIVSITEGIFISSRPQFFYKSFT